MSVQAGLLALLTLGPAYGSQLQAEFLARAAHRRQLNAGQVYATLDRLGDQGLVEAAGTTDDGLPLYRLTNAGSVSAASWLSGDATPRLEWDEMQDHVLIAASIDAHDALLVVRAYRDAFSTERVDLNPDSGSTADSWAELAANLRAAAALEWLDHMATALQHHPLALVRERSTDRPRRGRRPQSLAAKTL